MVYALRGGHGLRAVALTVRSRVGMQEGRGIPRKPDGASAFATAMTVVQHSKCGQ
jgi:hypothetical protein